MADEEVEESPRSGTSSPSKLRWRRMVLRMLSVARAAAHAALLEAISRETLSELPPGSMPGGSTDGAQASDYVALTPKSRSAPTQLYQEARRAVARLTPGGPGGTSGDPMSIVR